MTALSWAQGPTRIEGSPVIIKLPMRRNSPRPFKVFLIVAYMALEFCGHKHFVEHQPFGEARSYYGPNESCRDAIAPINKVLRGNAAARELDSFLFKRGRSSQGLRSASSSVTGTIVTPLLDRFTFAPYPGQYVASLIVEAPASAASLPAPLLAALSPPVASAAPPQLII